ncbi:MAG TPA: hypothetical protein VMV04_20560 [Thermodesulfobacteriota bacterium]|nr:hypothetical protein [Thermodesulfobacteriota bacterium]
MKKRGGRRSGDYAEVPRPVATDDGHRTLCDRSLQLRWDIHFSTGGLTVRGFLTF